MDFENVPVDIVFDSNVASYGTYDAPGFQFQQPLVNVVGIQPLWSNIPYSFYVIDRTCNQFYIYTECLKFSAEKVDGDTFRLRDTPSPYDRYNVSEKVERYPDGSGEGFGPADPEDGPFYNFEVFYNGRRSTVITDHTHDEGLGNTDFTIAPVDEINALPLNETYTVMIYRQRTLVSLAPGSYTPDSFAAEFIQACASTSLLQGINFHAQMNPASARLEIFNTGLIKKYKFALEIPNAYLGYIMGFEPNVVYFPEWDQVWSQGAILPTTNSDGSFNQWTLLAPGLVNFSYSPVINVHSSLAQKLGAASQNDADAVSDVLMKVPIMSVFASYLFYQPPSAIIPVRRMTLDRINFRLSLNNRSLYGAGSNSRTNTDYEEVDYLPLNGVPYQVAIRFIVDNGISGLN